MINKIIYNYDLFPQKMFFDDSYYFYIDDIKYRLRKIDDCVINTDLNSVKLFDELIPTVSGELFIIFNDKKYCLYKINCIEEINVSLYDIDLLSIESNDFDIPALKKTWVEKIDKIEMQLIEFNKEYKKIRESFNYYVGLGEIALTLLDNVEINCKSYKVHSTLSSVKEYKDFYNPLNVCSGFKAQDYSYYIMNNEDYKFERYIRNMNDDEQLMLLVFLLFPSNYFEKVSKIIEKEEEEKCIDKIVSNRNKYNNYLKGLYKYLKTKQKLPYIELLCR